MSINLVTYANQTVTPTNDAIIYENAIDQNGIFHGCNVTVSGNDVNITGGYGIVCGREFVIESESIPVTLAPSGTLDGRLYVRLDLADADAPIQLLTAQGNTLPPLEQDTDVNYVNGAYEMELATFTVGVSALSGVTETYETIVGSKEGFMNLDANASPGTTDGDLYAAITALGWDSDVEENNILDVKKTLTKMLDFKVEGITSSSFNISANGATDLQISVAKAGYTPIGIVGYDFGGTGVSNLVPFRMKQESGIAYVSVRNDSGTARSGMTATVFVLYIVGA